MSISPDPLSFDLDMSQGESKSKSFSISNVGGGTLTWKVSADKQWIDISPTSGTESAKVTININTAGLNPGVYKGTITITSNVGTRTGSINLKIAKPPELSVSGSLSFNFGNMSAGELNSRAFSISNAGGGNLTWSISDDQPWITMNPASGTNSGTVTVSVGTSGLSSGSYSGTITITSNGGNKKGNVNLNIASTLQASIIYSNNSQDFPSGQCINLDTGLMYCGYDYDIVEPLNAQRAELRH